MIADDLLYTDPAAFIESAPGARFIRIISGRVVHDMEIMPEGYGIAWPMWNHDAYVCAPMPWNVVLSVGFKLWTLVRGGVGGWRWPKAIQAAYDNGYRKGKVSGEWESRDRHKRELLDAERRGYVKALEFIAADLARGGRDT